MLEYPRPCCARCYQEGRTSCTWCGTAIIQGRAATPREQYETSEEARHDRLQQIEASRRDTTLVDAQVDQVVRTLFTCEDTFTYEHLAEATQFNRMALKYALQRLCKQGVVKVVGKSKIRPGRYRPVWQLQGATLPRDADDHSGSRRELISSSGG
jgi:hypothetical protein